MQIEMDTFHKSLPTFDRAHDFSLGMALEAIVNGKAKRQWPEEQGAVIDLILSLSLRGYDRSGSVGKSEGPVAQSEAGGQLDSMCGLHETSWIVMLVGLGTFLGPGHFGTIFAKSYMGLSF